MTLLLRRLAIVALAAAAVAAPAAAQEAAVITHGPAKAADELVRTERAFAARSMEAGAAVAFAEYLDPADSRAFMGGEPVKGADAIGAAHAGPGKLNWQPREVFASKAGDMGVAWGQFRFDIPGGGAVTGRYVTVWRKDAKGAWKGIIDIGTPDPAPKSAG